jgi:hypothetical protein
MKKKVASRRLKRTCDQCKCKFKKGDVYYVDRRVFFDEEIVSFEYTYCAKCNYRNKSHLTRFQRFIDSESCKHPITDEVWSPIPGDTHLLQPDHLECEICGKWI